MNGCRSSRVRAAWLMPLLAGCMVRWESTPENDEYWEAAGRDRPLPRSPGAWPEPPGDGASRDRPPPLTSESDPPEDAEQTGLPAGLYRDLIVLEPGIVGGPLADGRDPDAIFSFRAQMEWLAGGSRDAYEFTRAWLDEWESASEVGPALAPVAPRPGVRRLVDAWLEASVRAGEAAPRDASGDAPGDAPRVELASYAPAPEEGPSGAGEPGAYGPPEALPSWEQVPFRLIAIVNRVDLASSACGGYPGELRYVYTAVDPVTHRPLDATVILEVPYPTTRSAAEWARAWRELAASPEGEAHAQGLEALTREVRAEADPLRARLRSNELAFSNPEAPVWEMREFQLQVRGDRLELGQVPLEFTPRADADPAALAAYVLEHAEAIEGSGARLPDELRAGAAGIDTADFRWSVLGVSERLRRAFSVQTCNGCHGGDTEALPFQHVGPASSLEAPARLSRFLYDPDATSDELRRRTRVLDTLSATVCESPAGDAYGGE